MKAGAELKRGLWFALLAAAALLCPAAPAAAQQEAAVLAKGSGPYFESYLAFQRELGRPVTPFDLSKGKPRFSGDLRAVAAFGIVKFRGFGSEGVTVVWALAPGYFPHTAFPRAVRVSSLPEPGKALAAFRQLQPGLKRLAVLRHLHQPNNYIEQLNAAGRAAGVEIIDAPISLPGEFPKKLRGLLGKADALWLFPAPDLINKTSLAVLAEFSCANKVPFYAPSAGLVTFGATAAYAPGFSETGAAAAKALQAVLDGKEVPAMVFAEAALTVNARTAAGCGLSLRLPEGGGQ
jgi:hypothetical protein